MKKILTAAVLTLALAGTAFALSDSEYLTLKKSNADFARADKHLTQVWKKVTGSMSGRSLKAIRDEQREWIDLGRDEDAAYYMSMGYSRAEAYAMATNDRAEYIPQRAREIRNGK